MTQSRRKVQLMLFLIIALSGYHPGASMLFDEHDTGCLWLRNASRDSALAGLRPYQLCDGRGESLGRCGPFVFRFHASMMTYEGVLPNSAGVCQAVKLSVEPGSAFASITTFHGDDLRVVATQTEPRRIDVNVYDSWKLQVIIYELYADVSISRLTSLDDDVHAAPNTQAYAPDALYEGDFSRGEDGVYHGWLPMDGERLECLLQPMPRSSDAMWMIMSNHNASNAVVRPASSNRYDVHVGLDTLVAVHTHATGAHVSIHQALAPASTRGIVSKHVRMGSGVLDSGWSAGAGLFFALFAALSCYLRLMPRHRVRLRMLMMGAAGVLTLAAVIYAAFKFSSSSSRTPVSAWVARQQALLGSIGSFNDLATTHLVGASVNASRFPTVSELLPLYHPLAPYPATRQFRAELATGWFGGFHPYFKGDHTCPASGCMLRLTQWTHDYDAHAVLYFMGPDDYFIYVIADRVRPPARRGRQLVVMMTSEVFDLEQRPDDVFKHFNAEHSFRPSSFVRDSYVLWFISDAATQGMRPQGPISMTARVWADIWEAPLPLSARNRDGRALATWASGYCNGSASNREQLVRELQAAGLDIAIFGGDRNCMRNVNATLLAAPRTEQFAAMRASKFHLAFENQRTEGYVTEKLYWALLRGQVPIVLGAPDIARHVPDKHSYIDATDFDSPHALVDFLHSLDADDAAYEAYHAWRTNRSFAEYGDILREELVEVIWLANSSASHQDWYTCRMCHALERAAARGDLGPAATRVGDNGNIPRDLPSLLPLGLRPMSRSARPAWPAK